MENGTALHSGSDETPTRRWGFWATVGFTLSILLAFMVVQVLAALAWAWYVKSMEAGTDSVGRMMQTDGGVVAVSFIASAPFMIVLSVFFAWIKDRDGIRNYLGLHLPSRRRVMAWCAVLIAFAACSDALTILLGRPVCPPVMVNLYRNTSDGMLPLLWVSIILVAPLSEEILFRGFLFAGLKSSMAGAAGAVVVSSAFWALIHVQYDAYGVGLIFASGIVLGLARLRTGSVLLCAIMHGLMNGIATIQTHYFAFYAG